MGVPPSLHETLVVGIAAFHKVPPKKVTLQQIQQ